MDCNKEEAIKAMQLAERKMQDNDFTGARKMAQKAQQLFPGLENISQLLAVCEVHCSAENKLDGSEMDWYGILQVQRFSHEAIIKKQFRKLGLLLNPDKNMVAGAEAAFKLIGEANAVLDDRGKHFRYDMKCRALLRTGVIQSSAHQFNENLFVRKHCDAARNVQNIPESQCPGMNELQKRQADTFCTCCPFCKTVYPCAKDSANRLLRCQRCRRLFIASDCGIQGVHLETLRNQFANHTELPNQIPIKVVSNHGGTGNLPVTRFQAGNAASNPVSKAAVAADVDGASNTQKKNSEHGVAVRKEGVEISKSGSVKSKESGPSRNLNKKEGSQLNLLEVSRLETELDLILSMLFKKKSKNLSYIGNDDDDDFVNPPNWSGKSPLSSASEKKRKNAAVYGGCGSFNIDRSPYSADAAVDGHKKKARQKVSFPLEECMPSKKSKTGEPVPDNDETNFKANVTPGPNVDVASTPQLIEVPDPQFHKFVLNEDKLASIFKANQTWALFDDEADGMPRYYAFVKKVLHTPGFKLKIIWLDANPDNRDHRMFSHQVHCRKGRGKSSFLVYPRKGETWALYKNWDIGWSSEPEKHIPYKYEFVEVLSDFVDDIGTEVASLAKVKGFVSLFEQKKQSGDILHRIPPNELYRFSHRIPSFKMTGNERDDVPKGSFELDPASLPTNLDELF
ncbi:putative DnaJ domain-containing protein [Rosa chinensis]|uniref:Putative DnaJ domain-containing protein n=1 Tax=Rosa chinensis TaxID=74649 RepID=A0A2P6R6I0_ROSCH|nr:putative DnaJ domain-containing protein [Rosa chinensis]